MNTKDLQYSLEALESRVADVVTIQNQLTDIVATQLNIIKIMSFVIILAVGLFMFAALK